MKFSYHDLQQIEKLRIGSHSSAPDQVIALADEFNQSLNQIQKAMDEFFTTPEFDPSDFDPKDVEKIAKERRVLRFSLMNALLELLTARIVAGEIIPQHLHQAATDGLSKFKAIQTEYTKRFSDSGLSGPALTAAVSNVDKVREAHNAMNNQREIITTMIGSENMNLQPAHVVRIQAGFIARFRSWIGELADFESKPVNPELPPPQQDWRSNKVVIPGTPATRG